MSTEITLSEIYMVEQAIKLCEEEVAEKRENVETTGILANTSSLEFRSVYRNDLKEAKVQLTAWLTHRAEFEDHPTRWDPSGRYKICVACSNPNGDLWATEPCASKVAKAKRLLGVTE